MNKYEIRTRKKKDAILKAALTLFKEKGYTQVSIMEIAAYSGVSSVSLYNYFDSKEGLIKECANVLMQETIQMAKELLSQNISFKEKLLQVVALCSDKNQQLLGEYFSQEALSDKMLIDLYNENTNQIRMEILHDFIESGKEEGVIDPAISTQTIMEYLQAIAGIHMPWEATGDSKTKINDLYKLVLYGLVGHK
ncbi:TetR/AcrR family transcriptional regulator [Paenibacillus eucommiae]|uniref:AcrR family transcriptional regulator n=1 Tax=Paenibacillus eucommiae TaxID=1355755 RepID=A0ABS4IQT4_9BACL|nr:TetR/AcrR family transcriptional regulator [Paenibacillus eucommiae]MBP1989878.1 AcrR family transcriptional regulator [Paenibacillus eucommiae]